MKKSKEKYSGWKVLQIDRTTGKTIRIWPSARTAEEDIAGKNNCCIAKACRGSLLTAYGYEWRYAETRHTERFVPKEKKRRF